MPVPISFGYLAIFLTLYAPGTKQGFISYLIGFFFMSVITGFFIDRWPGSDFYADGGRELQRMRVFANFPISNDRNPYSA